MKSLKKFVVFDHQTIKDAISVIQGNLSRCVIVVNNKNKVVGTFSEGDVLRLILEDIELHSSIKRVVNPSFRYLNKKDMLRAYQMVKKNGITLIPVIDRDFILKDVITIFQVIDHLSFASKKRTVK
ncbi:MAG: CBS domain-containing protein [Candidatus Omnitrophica bacterium]|nr:CBS domain-containing protein [Candidatus Omnitrophota bacterium]